MNPNPKRNVARFLLDTPRLFLLSALPVLATCLEPSTLPHTPRQPSPDLTLSRVAFGSCSFSNRPQPLWDPILATDPQLWVWMGDNIYGDSENVQILRAKYRAASENEGYRRLVARVPVVGTWDDHDYGLGNGGKEYPSRIGSQGALLDFLGEPRGSPRRRQEGVYASYTFGSPPKQVRVILLDVRYHRDPPGPEGDILGDAQWKWLEGELRRSNAQVHLIGSGFQVLPVDHRFEKWADFPLARARLLRLIADSRVPGVILLSGDRHLGEISMLETEPLEYPLFEVTSSGMTHFVTRPDGEPNRFRTGPLFTGLNFGVVEIEWENPTPLIRLQIRGEDGSPGAEIGVELSRLAPGA